MNNCVGRRMPLTYLFVAVLLAGCVSGCGDSPSDRAVQPVATTSSPLPSSAALDFGKIPGEFPVGEPIAAGAQLAPVGACVSLQGAPPEPSLSVVDCGSPNNGFKVVQRVATPAECTSDVDQRFYMNPEGGQFTACLDYAWSSQDCLSISKYSATRVACDAAGVGDREKPVDVIAGATSIGGCPTGGFAHGVRRFTVCTQTLH